MLTPRYSESNSNDNLHIELVQTFKLIDHLRATRWTPPDYWQSDNSNGLVMVIRSSNYAVIFGIRKLESRSYRVALFAWFYVYPF